MALTWASIRKRTCLHLGVAAPDGELEHELLDGGEERVYCGQARRDDHIACRVSRHEWVAVAVAAHPRPKVEQVVRQRQHRLPDLRAMQTPSQPSTCEVAIQWLSESFQSSRRLNVSRGTKPAQRQY